MNVAVLHGGPAQPVVAAEEGIDRGPDGQSSQAIDRHFAVIGRRGRPVLAVCGLGDPSDGEAERMKEPLIDLPDGSRLGRQNPFGR